MHKDWLNYNDNGDLLMSYKGIQIFCYVLNDKWSFEDGDRQRTGMRLAEIHRDAIDL
jgi:hypothetical protein